jgi:hypothetical protein
MSDNDFSSYSYDSDGTAPKTWIPRLMFAIAVALFAWPLLWLAAVVLPNYLLAEPQCLERGFRETRVTFMLTRYCVGRMGDVVFKLP